MPMAAQRRKISGDWIAEEYSMKASIQLHRRRPGAGVAGSRILSKPVGVVF
jgi:hypothetical protein